jgi:hypothetical protein
MAAARPMRPDCQALYQKHARALIDKSRQEAITEAVAESYHRLGLAPPVEVFQAGEAIPAASTRLEKIVRPLLQAVNVAQWRELLLALEGRVCRVELDHDPPGFGTGFLVGPDLLLTNHHVLAPVILKRLSPEKVRLRFDYKHLPNLELSPGIVVGLASGDWLVDASPPSLAEQNGDPDGVPPTDEEMDYALIRLDRPIGRLPIPPAGLGGRPRGWIEVPAADPPIYPRMALQILQHPRSASLKLATATDGVIGLNTNGTRLRYATETEEGSSGPPCFNMDWGLIALHHLGDPGFRPGDRQPTRPKYNQGIPIGKIRDLLARRQKANVLGGPSL